MPHIDTVPRQLPKGIAYRLDRHQTMKSLAAPHRFNDDVSAFARACAAAVAASRRRG
jgi:hypothetical protein